MQRRKMGENLVNSKKLADFKMEACAVMQISEEEEG